VTTTKQYYGHSKYLILPQSETMTKDLIKNTTTGACETKETMLDIMACVAAEKDTSTRINPKPCRGELQYLEADPSVRCWEGGHTLWAMLLGLPMLLVYGVGIPFGVFMILHWRRKKLDQPRCRVVYGFMYSNFKLEYYFWDCMVYTRKAVFAMAATLLRPSGAELQCSAGILIIFVAYFFQSRKTPYIEDSLNVSEVRCAARCAVCAPVYVLPLEYVCVCVCVCVAGGKDRDMSVAGVFPAFAVVVYSV
jgi:hypothetical protein